MPWKFVLVSDTDPNCHIELKTTFVPDLAAEYHSSDLDAEKDGLCDVWSSDAAHAEALRCLGYSVAVVKKDLDNDES
jgi:hypothetical protein